MTDIPPEVERYLADLSTSDFHALLARTRPPEDYSPYAKAAAALRQQHYRVLPTTDSSGRGHLDNVNGAPSDKERAVAALRAFQGSDGPTYNENIDD